MTEGPKCALCRRSLKHPSPTGYGPVCWRKLHGRRRHTTRIPARYARPLPGQLALDHDDYDPGSQWIDDLDYRAPSGDLWGQHATYQQLVAMTTVQVAGGWL